MSKQWSRAKDSHDFPPFLSPLHCASPSSCQVLFKDGVFQWKRLENLITLAKEQVALSNRSSALAATNRTSRSELESTILQKQ